MKVLHIVAGELSGGAARGAYWLHQALVELGVDSKILTNSQINLGDERVIGLVNSPTDKLKSMLRRTLEGLSLLPYARRKRVIFSTGALGIDVTKVQEYREADIIHLHWINDCLVNIRHLSKVNKPIVWTMRDMWPMTGGCHYTLGCANFKSGCGYCRQLHSNLKYDLSRYVLHRKKKYLPPSVKIVGISPWITEEAKRSELFRDFDVRHISNNVNTEVFYPIDKRLAKKALNIPTEKKVVLVGAQNPQDFYKGFDKCLQAVPLLDRSKIVLCFFGELKANVAKSLGFEYKSFGFLHDSISLRVLYSASDVFVAPSLMEAFGKTLAESMACGTPVVCFDATGPKHIVDHKVNGYKARPFDTTDLANGIDWILNLNEDQYQQLCLKAREKVLREFDSNVVARKYIELYEEVISRSGH